MKTRNATWPFLGGALFGISLALCLGAVDKPASTPHKSPEVPRNDSPRLLMVAYPSGATGFFDTVNSTFYLYDSDLVNCISIREITALGEPMRRARN